MFGCITPALFLYKDICAEGGGYHNHVTYSPDGSLMVASSDVGGLRWWDGTRWQYLPVKNNAARQVAGAAITNDGTIYALVGNGTSVGELLEIDTTTGQITTLDVGFYVRANSPSLLDTGDPRPRPTGYVVAYDEVNDVVYFGTEDGLWLHDKSTGTSTRIALPGESIRAIAHDNDAVLQDPDYLIVATRSSGLVRIDNPLGTPVISTLIASPARFEDVAFVDEAQGSVLAVAHDQGVFLYDGATTFDVTPTLAPAGTQGANLGDVRYTAVAVANSGMENVALVGVVNPRNGDEWLYFNPDIDMADGGDWEPATPEPATILKGSTYNSPLNRLLGGTAPNGANQIGLSSISFNPTNINEATVSSSLSLFQSLNVLDDKDWATFNAGLSVLSISDIHIDSEGYTYMAGPDHNFYVLSPTGLLTLLEPTLLGVQGIRDGWSVFSIGTGADKVVLFAPADDNNPNNPLNDIKYSRGTGPVTTLSTTTYNNTISGRPGGLFGWDNGDGTYTAVGWSDGDGHVYSDYDLATDSWTPWTAQTSGPVSNTGNINQERQITGASDGSVLFSIHLTTGELYRSLDQGVTWQMIAPGLGTNVSARTGRMVYDESKDMLVYTDGNGLHRIDDASGTATVTSIAGIDGSGQLAIDSQGCIYFHEHTGGLANLYRFDDFQTATEVGNALQIANEDYRRRAGDLANTMTIGWVAGLEVLMVGGQGTGALAGVLPEKGDQAC